MKELDPETEVVIINKEEGMHRAFSEDFDKTEESAQEESVDASTTVVTIKESGVEDHSPELFRVELYRG